MDDLEEDLGLYNNLVDDDGDSSDNNSSIGRKKLKLSLVQPMFEETKKETGFNKSCRTCLEQIREAMLHHRWQEAAEYMACSSQILEEKALYTTKQYKELVWRASTEILHHHPKSLLEDYNIIYERLKHSGFKLYLKVSLEHSFHLMLQGKLEDAKQNLSAAESWRYGKESSAQIQQTKLIQAYRSLLDYIIWSEKKIAVFNNSTDTFDAHSENQSMHNYFRQASVNLKEILSHPGVWDPFIVSYVEMLEFYEDHEEALKVLNDYAFDNSFPPNPNAHIYLYNYLKQHDAPQKKLMHVLKNLQLLVPSHELMLEYSALLLQTEKQKNTQKALGVVLEMLDYACWRNNLDVWMCLKTIILKLQTNDDWESIVSEIMTSRKEWWPALHFTRFHARKDSEENPELLEVKALLGKILCPDLKYAQSQ